MEFEITWIEPLLVSVRTSGPASAADFEAMYQQLVAHPSCGPGLLMLSDHTDLDVSSLTMGDIEKIAALRERWTGSLSARSALVVGVSAPVRYGLARMFEALAASAGNNPVRVFETTDEALAWLRGTGPAEP